MKGDWNERARENARYYIATSVPDDLEAFIESGKRDVGHVFDKIEHLLHENQTVLDIGCGVGRMDEHVAPRVAHLTGIDVSGEMVKRATERLAHLDNVKFVECSGRTLAPLEDASFGLVFSHIVFQHTPRDVTRGYFDEVVRVLKPGGHFLFQMPGADSHTPGDPPQADSFEMRYWTEEDLRSELGGRGFEVQEVRRFAAGDENFQFEQLRILAHKPE